MTLCRVRSLRGWSFACGLWLLALHGSICGAAEAGAVPGIAVWRAKVERLEPRWRAQPPSLGTPAADLDELDSLAEGLRALGRYSDARALREQLWTVALSLRGERDPATLALMAARVQVEMESARHEEALAIAERVVQLRTEVLGPRDPATLASLTDLAEAQKQLGRPDEGLRLVEQAVAALLDTLGERHRLTLDALRVQALSLQDTGREQEALVVAERVLRLRTATVGERDRDTLEAMVNVGRVLGGLQRRDEQAAILDKAYRLRIAELGERHPSTLLVMGSVGLSLPVPERLPMQQQVLQWRSEALGPQHPHTLYAMLSVARSLGAMKQREEQVALFQQALQLLIQTLGERHLDTLAAKEEWADLLGELGRIDDRLALREAVLQARRAAFGDSNMRTQLSMHNLAWASQQAGRHVQATEWGETALALRAATLGENHPWTLRTLTNLRDSTAALPGRLEDLARLNARLLAGLRASKGLVDTETLAALTHLARNYRSLDRNAEALALLPDFTAGAEGLVATAAAQPRAVDPYSASAEGYALFSGLKSRAGQLEEGWQLAEMSRRGYDWVYAGVERARKAGVLPAGDQARLDAAVGRVKAAAGRLTPPAGVQAALLRQDEYGLAFTGLSELVVQLAKDVPAFADAARPRIVQPRQLGAMLAADEVALSYVFERDRAAVWRVDASGALQRHELGSIPRAGTAIVAYAMLVNLARTRAVQGVGARLAAGLRVFRLDDGGFVLQQGEPSAAGNPVEVKDPGEVADWLSSRLLGPMADLLRGKQRWLIGAGGPLAGLAFGELQLDGQPVLRGRRIRTVGSMSLFAADPASAKP